MDAQAMVDEFTKIEETVPKMETTALLDKMIKLAERTYFLECATPEYYFQVLTNLYFLQIGLGELKKRMNEG